MSEAVYQLSICITVANRSRMELPSGQVLQLLPDCIDSLVAAIRSEDEVEIIISDYQSIDWPLAEWLPDRLGEIPHRIVSCKGKHHPGTGRNVAAEQTRYSNLCFLDTDMIVPRSVLLNGQRYLKNGQAYFPVCFYFLDVEHRQGFWCTGGRGNCLVTRQMLNQAGKWPAPQHYNRPREEDRQFYQRIEQSGGRPQSEKEPGFFHQYHPGWSVDNIFKRWPQLIEQYPEKVS